MCQDLKNTMERNSSSEVKMNFIKVFTQDIKRALYTERYRLVIAFLMITAMLLIPTNTSNAIYKKTTEYGNMNFFDYVFYMLCGLEKVLPEKLKDIQIPFSWMTIQFLCGFVTLDYIQNDQKNIGKAVLVKSRSKISWWVSKCLCLTSMVVTVYLLLYGVSAAIAALNYELGNGLHMELLRYVCNLKNIFAYTDGMRIYIMIVPLIISIGITLMQAGISQYLSPVIGLVTVLSVDVISVFSNSKLLWGNWSMILRSNLCLDGGIDMWKAVTAGIVVGIIGCIIGGVRFCNKDII